MVLFLKLHRLIIRQHIYLVLCIILLFLLIWWNSILPPNSVGSRFDQYFNTASPAEPIQVIDKPISDTRNEDSILSKIKGNVVSLTVYMEAQCPDTTGFVKRQLLPSWRRLGPTKRLSVTLIPFGKASCSFENEDYQCQCQHGSSECELNQLMNCVIDHLADPIEHIPIIGCIQGGDVKTVFQGCLQGHRSSSWLWNCARSKHGRLLHATAGNKTALIGNKFNFVPWIVLDGVRVNDAFYALEENLCKKFDSPKPAQCERFI